MTTTKTKNEWDELLQTEQKKKRVKVSQIDVADGGYLTWLYGSSTNRMQAWPPDFLRSAIIFMDSDVNNRRLRSPHYKQDRIDRRDTNERSYETWRLVKDFQKIIVEDPRLKFISVQGCEADDLVALAAWKFGDPTEPLRVFGQDKDLLQIGSYFDLVNKDGEAVTLEHFHEGLPKGLQKDGPLESWHIPLVLSLLGDKSDSVPRFLPRGPSGLAQLAELLWRTERPHEAFSRDFPEAIGNLYDVLLPDPALLGLSIDETVQVLKEGRWTPALLSRLNPSLKRRVKRWKLR